MAKVLAVFHDVSAYATFILILIAVIFQRRYHRFTVEAFRSQQRINNILGEALFGPGWKEALDATRQPPSK